MLWAKSLIMFFRQNRYLNSRVLSVPRVFLVILVFNFGCSSSPPRSDAKSQAEYPVKWINDNTLHIKSYGLVPNPKRDSSTNKLMACQDARARSIEIFSSRFTRQKPERERYYGRQFNDDFHDYKMKISTISKNNDEKGNCEMIMEYYGLDLKKRLTEK